MAIPPYVSRKLADHYSRTGDTKALESQQRSNANAADTRNCSSIFIQTGQNVYTHTFGNKTLRIELINSPREMKVRVVSTSEDLRVEPSNIVIKYRNGNTMTLDQENFDDIPSLLKTITRVELMDSDRFVFHN